MVSLDIRKKLEGMHTVETIAHTLNITKSSANNLVTELRKNQYLTTYLGGGQKIRIYKITVRKQLPRSPGMYDLLNQYSPHMQLAEPFDHQVHGPYGPEEALIDAIETRSFRVLLASLHLFRGITDWKKLYALAKKADVWQEAGALHDVARQYLRLPRMPSRYRKTTKKTKKFLVRNHNTQEERFQPITQEWSVEIPFTSQDMKKPFP